MNEPTARRTCQTCGGEIEWTKHSDRDQAGWRHVERRPGEVHAAYPAGGAACTS